MKGGHGAIALPQLESFLNLYKKLAQKPDRPHSIELLLKMSVRSIIDGT